MRNAAAPRRKEPCDSSSIQTPAKKFARRLLTVRERHVLEWMAEGKRDREIAAILDISCRTVEHHVRSILAKLDVETRTAAVRRATRHGFWTRDGFVRLPS